MALFEIIRDKISENGPVSFKDFMDLCLYHSEFGYYSSKEEIIGEEGDYITSPIVSPIFGFMVGKQLEEMRRIVATDDFSVIEFGAGTGHLSRNILNFFKSIFEEKYTPSYKIIEKSLKMREKEKKLLNNDVNWIDSLEEAKNFNGCILAHEVLDNFPVHKVVMKKELMEVFVDFKKGFFEVLKPASALLKNYFRELEIELPSGYQTEINIEAIKWLEEVSSHLQSGYIMIFDYGYPGFEMYRNYRCNGTMMCYFHHKVNDCPYINIGQQDITSHVNFSALYHWGQKFGLECVGFSNQGHFLARLGFDDFLKQYQDNIKEPGRSIRNRIFLREFLLYDLGEKIKVMVLKKGVPEKKLMGFS